MSRKFVIGLDFGTKSARALLADAKTGECSAAASADYAHGVMDEYLPDGTKLKSEWALQYPGDYLAALVKVVTDVLNTSHADASDVVGLSLDFTACTMLPVDEALVPLCFHDQFAARPHAYVKLWKHHGAQEQTARINRILESRGVIDHVRYGGKVSTELLIPKITQILEEDPDVYQAADQMLEAVDWISQTLTGSKRRSASTASYKAWWNAESGYPVDIFAAIDPRMADLAGTKLAGKVCPVGGRFGGLTKEWADKLGLTAGTAVGCGIIDAHAGLPGCGIIKPGKMMLIIGTSSVQAALSERPYSGRGIMGGVRDAIIPGYYALETGQAAVGDIFEWFIKKALPAEYVEKAGGSGVNMYRYLSAAAKKARPGASGLLALDWWTGNKTPFIDADLCGVIAGYTLSTKPEEVYRAIVEATGFGNRMTMEYFEEAGVRIDEIIACGGIAEKDDFLMQVYADIANRTIRSCASGGSAALGAAMYASAAAGVENGGHANIEEAARAMCGSPGKCYKPNPDNAARYDILYGAYKELSGIFEKSDIMHTLRKLSLQV
jgi:L-ribulokinase